METGVQTQVVKYSSIWEVKQTSCQTDRQSRSSAFRQKFKWSGFQTQRRTFRECDIDAVRQAVRANQVFRQVVSQCCSQAGRADICASQRDRQAVRPIVGLL